ncbi:MAG: hypothetical protein KGL95_06105 [Patescibacteria group bacterium]|nr:hypothetical protein [Patescibacteria group bacterium]
MKIRYEHKANPNDIVKIRVHMSMKDVAEWDKIRDEVCTWAQKKGFVVNTIQPIVAYDVGSRAKPSQGQKKSDGQYLDQYVRRSGIDEKTAEIGKQIVETL